jgi:hypothetical protein
MENYYNTHKIQMRRIHMIINSLDICCAICGIYLHDKPDKPYAERIMKGIYVCSKECKGVLLPQMKNVP